MLGEDLSRRNVLRGVFGACSSSAQRQRSLSAYFDDYLVEQLFLGPRVEASCCSTIRDEHFAAQSVRKCRRAANVHALQV